MSPASRPNRYRAASSARSSLVGGVMAIEISLRCELLGCGSITSLLAGPVDRGAAGPEWGDSPDPEVGGTPPGPGLACSPGMAPRMTSPLAAEEHLSQYRADEVVWHLAAFTHSDCGPERYASRPVEPPPDSGESPSRAAALSLRIFGRTWGLIGSASKSASQRSGVSSG